jgi:hypothetical protein
MNIFAEFKEDMRNLLSEQSNKSANISSSVSQPSIAGGNADYFAFNWGGRFHTIPEGFSFPSKCNLKNLWDLWFVGDSERRISPYMRIKCFDLIGKSDKSLRSKAAVCISFMLSSGAVTESMVLNSSQSQKDAYFAVHFNSLCRLLYPGKSPSELDIMRVGDRSFVTFYDSIVKIARSRVDQQPSREQQRPRPRKRLRATT